MYVSYFMDHNPIFSIFPQSKKAHVQYVQYYNGQYQTATLNNEIVVKSPNKLHNSPAKKRSYLSPIKSLPLAKNHSEITPDQNQHPPFRTRLAALPSISPLEYGRRRIEASPSFSVKQPQKNEPWPQKSTSCKRRYVLVTGLFVSIALSLYFSIYGSYQPDRLDDVESTQRYLTSYEKKEDTAQSAAITKINAQSAAITKINDNIPVGTDSHVDKHVGEPVTIESSTDITKNIDVEGMAKSLDGSTAEDNDFSNGFVRKGSMYFSPYKTYQKSQKASKFAYAYVISGCNEDAAHRNYLYDISISTYVQREAGSTADVIVFIQMAFKSDLDSLPEQDRMLLEAMDIYVRYIPKAEDESFYRTMLDKFLILGLTQYDRVLFMDGDVMARGNLDYLFDLSMKGVLKKNVVTAGKTEPANGGFFMLTPSEGARDRVMAIIFDKEKRGSNLPYPHWDEVIGWGHVFGEKDYAEFVNGKKKDKWDFYGAFADQGKLKMGSISIVWDGLRLIYSVLTLLHLIQNRVALPVGKIRREVCFYYLSSFRSKLGSK
jgi:hypothetical protein